MISNRQSKIGNFDFKPMKLATMHLFIVIIKDESIDSSMWYLDLRATCHMTPNKE